MMHELWLCKSIMEIIQQSALTTNTTKVKKIVLEIGQLTAVDKDSLLFSFQVTTQGTLAEDAELYIIDIPGIAQCESCRKMVPLRQYYDTCQACGSHALTVTQGEELRVKSMEVE